MPERGFTLVELMAVLLVLGLMATAVVVTAAPSPSVHGDAARLAGRVAAARDLAVTANRPISAWVSNAGYGFDEWRSGQWRPITRKPLVTTTWPESTSVQAGGLAGRAASASGGAARITFDNLGLPDSSTTFALVRDGKRAIVAIDSSGAVDIRD